MSCEILIAPLEADAFAPFGDLLDVSGPPDRLIFRGLCGRHQDRARLDFGDGRAGISLFDAVLRSLPDRLEMVERHPESSQAFVPMSQHPLLMIVAPDDGGRPGRPKPSNPLMGRQSTFSAAPGLACSRRSMRRDSVQ